MAYSKSWLTKVALAALADPTRRAIYESLRGSARAVGRDRQRLPGLATRRLAAPARAARSGAGRPSRAQGTRRLYAANAAAALELRDYFQSMWECAMQVVRAPRHHRGETPCTQAPSLIATPTLAPIVVEVVVPCPPDRAFDYFTRDIGRWWPLASHSLGGRTPSTSRFEPREGGRLVETLRDGDEHTWGTVTAWQPGRRVAFSWHLDRDPATAQYVDVHVRGDRDGTRVTLTHGGWERRDDGARRARTTSAAGSSCSASGMAGIAPPTSATRGPTVSA